MSANFFKYQGTVQKINDSFMPKPVHRDLKWYLASFLMLYPMPEKKVKIYKKLEERNKLSFIIRYLIGVAYQNDVNKRLLKLHKELASNSKFYHKATDKTENEIVELTKAIKDLQQQQHDLPVFALNLAKRTREISNKLLTKFNEGDVLIDDIKSYRAKRGVYGVTLTQTTTVIIDTLHSKKMKTVEEADYPELFENALKYI